MGEVVVAGEEAIVMSSSTHRKVLGLGKDSLVFSDINGGCRIHMRV